MPAVPQRNTSQSEPASAADHEKGRRLCPAGERVPNGRLAVPRGGAGPHLPIQTALIQAHQGMEQIISGKATTMRQIAQALNMDRSFVARTLQLANLAPDIVKAIWENRQPVSLTLEKLRRGIPDSWEEQRKLFLEE